MKRTKIIATYILTAFSAYFAGSLADLQAADMTFSAEKRSANGAQTEATVTAITEAATAEAAETMESVMTTGSAARVGQLRSVLSETMVSVMTTGSAEQKSQIKIADGVTIDKDVHDFGEVITCSGPLSCTFTITNNSDKPIVIFSVASSCGCTDVKWTHEPIRPGESGTISATYSNDEGPIAFDKNLTVYFSNVKKPYTLKLRGICKAPKLSREEIYKHRVGSIGLVEMEASTGQIKRGLVKSASIQAANMSDSPVKVEFTELSPGLSVTMRKKGSEKTFSGGVIPKGEEFDIVFSVKADGTRWGKSKYTTKMTVDGTVRQTIKVFSFIVDNFDSMTAEQKHKGPNPAFKTSSYSFGIIDSGTTIHAEFEMENEGNGTLRIYKCDTDARRYSHSDIYPLRHGEKGKFRVHVDTSLMPKGETDIIVTLTTNSPLRPVVNLFISGYIQ